MSYGNSLADAYRRALASHGGVSNRTFRPSDKGGRLSTTLIKRREPIMRKGHTKGTAKAKKQTALSRDKLIKTTKKGDIELTEEELGKVAGGLIFIQNEPLKIPPDANQ
jgi:hypothetical protein